MDHDKRACEFQELFSDIEIPESLFTGNSKGESQFNKGCEVILNCFSKRWKPMLRALYKAHFASKKWKELAIEDKKKHTISNCAECSKKQIQLQEAFPGKPVFRVEPSISLPKKSQSEKEEVRTVLKDLNKQREERYGHSMYLRQAKVFKALNYNAISL